MVACRDDCRGSRRVGGCTIGVGRRLRAQAVVRLPGSDGMSTGRLLCETDAVPPLPSVQVALRRLLCETHAVSALPALQMAVRRLLPKTDSLRCVAIVIDETMLRPETVLQAWQIVDWIGA